MGTAQPTGTHKHQPCCKLAPAGPPPARPRARQGFTSSSHCRALGGHLKLFVERPRQALAGVGGRRRGGICALIRSQDVFTIYQRA